MLASCELALCWSTNKKPSNEMKRSIQVFAQCQRRLVNPGNRTRKNHGDDYECLQYTSFWAESDNARWYLKNQILSGPVAMNNKNK